MTAWRFNIDSIATHTDSLMVQRSKIASFEDNGRPQVRSQLIGHRPHTTQVAQPFFAYIAYKPYVALMGKIVQSTGLG